MCVTCFQFENSVQMDCFIYQKVSLLSAFQLFRYPLIKWIKWACPTLDRILQHRAWRLADKHQFHRIWINIVLKCLWVQKGKSWPPNGISWTDSLEGGDGSNLEWQPTSQCLPSFALASVSLGLGNVLKRKSPHFLLCLPTFLKDYT